MSQRGPFKREMPFAFNNTAFGRKYNTGRRCDGCPSAIMHSAPSARSPSPHCPFDAFHRVPAVPIESQRQRSEIYPSQGQLTQLAASRRVRHIVIASVTQRSSHDASPMEGRSVQALPQKPLPSTSTGIYQVPELKYVSMQYANDHNRTAEPSHPRLRVSGSVDDDVGRESPAWLARMRRRAMYALEWLP